LLPTRASAMGAAAVTDAQSVAVFKDIVPLSSILA
jgi:hypothetical protein